MTNARVEAIFSDVLAALKDIMRKHRVTWDEYRAATEWLTEAGRQDNEIPLLMDLFLSCTVDHINFPSNGGTESNIEGPFHVPGAPLLSPPYALPQRESEPGDVLLFSGSVRSTDDVLLAGAVLDVWQANAEGQYSRFYPGLPDYNLRGRLATDEHGRFEFQTVVPASYEIPKAGATGKLLAALDLHAFRPAHVHFRLTHEGFRPLTTQIYFEGDPWLDSDVAGAMKPALVTKLERRETVDQPYMACSYDFVLQPV